MSTSHCSGKTYSRLIGHVQVRVREGLFIYWEGYWELKGWGGRGVKGYKLESEN